MYSIRIHPFLRYLSSGLVILLLASSGGALPTNGKPDMAKSLATKGPVNMKDILKHGSAQHVPAKSCPVRAPQSKLHKRTVELKHPSAKEAITLFHGTISKDEAICLTDKVQLGIPERHGDMHDTWFTGCDGGLYFTDSIIAAAQFICYNKDPPPVDGHAYVVEFAWNPTPTGKNYKVHEFGPSEKVTPDKCTEFDMISGPMNQLDVDKGLTPSFWQYAVVKQDAATNGLAHGITYKIPCKKENGEEYIPKSTGLTDDLYMRGQKSNDGFIDLSSALIDGRDFCPA